jgi:hypothetical protein
MFFVKYFLRFYKHYIPFSPCSAPFLKKVLRHSARSGSELFKSLLHVSNGQNLVEIRR